MDCDKDFTSENLILSRQYCSSVVDKAVFLLNYVNLIFETLIHIMTLANDESGLFGVHKDENHSSQNFLVLFQAFSGFCRNVFESYSGFN